MKIETYLNAYAQSVYRLGNEDIYDHNSREFRQVEAFRERILRMGGDLEASEAYLEEALELMNQHWERIQDLKKQLAEKDTENEQLVVLSEEIVKKKDERIKDLLADYAGCFTSYKASKAFLAMRDKEIAELRLKEATREYD